VDCTEQAKVCEQKIGHKFEEIMDKLNSLERRLFVDNGNLSIQSKINRNSATLALVVGVLSVIGTFTLGIVGWIIKTKMGG